MIQAIRCVMAMTALVVGFTSQAKADFNQIVAFGDSLTDTGNVFLATGNATPVSSFYFNGRFTNGLTWIDKLSANLGLGPVLPSLAGGFDYAWGGAYLRHTASGVSAGGTPNSDTQIGQYLAAHNSFNANQLVVLWAGSNDILQGYSNIPQLASELDAQIRTLVQNGAKNILVPTLSPLGLAPVVFAQAGSNGVAGVNALTSQYNNSLTATIASLRSQLHVNIYSMDTYAATMAVVQNPATYGFTNVTDAALQGAPGDGTASGPLRANSSTFLFYDAVHPTAKAHQMVGDLATAAVPEPTSAVMIALGLGVLGIRQFSRRRAA